MRAPHGYKHRAMARQAQRSCIRRAHRPFPPGATRDQMIDFRTIPSIPKLFLARATMVPDRPCLWAKGRGGWASHSYRDVAERLVRLAAGLTALGVAPGDRV